MRRLWALIEGLPPEGTAVARAELGERATWTSAEHLQALIVDVLNMQRYEFLLAHSKKGDPVKKPKPVPRPGDSASSGSGQRRAPTLREGLAMLGLPMPPPGVAEDESN